MFNHAFGVLIFLKMIEDKKTTWTFVFTIIKYVATAVIAFIGGNASANILN